ncbi:MAG: Na+/H+ antiporter subunit E [Candidatus Oceanisphaera merdipullorum]|nr:Na+/H+ antiporter subunit E [Candidatus Oceanisphaera merdipullorum]
MNRWLPSPLLALALFLLWLMLNQSVEPAHLLLGAVLAVTAAFLTAPLRPIKATIHKPKLIIRLLSWAFIEIVHSCFNVSRIILFRKINKLDSQFIKVPLDLKDPYGLAALSCLINCTPGTVWVEVLQDKHELLLHIFDLHDEEWWINTIKQRYESPLIAIFESEKP